jgi:Zn-finger nucleic acid-binding protein
MDCPRCNTPLVPGRLSENSILEKVKRCEMCKGTFIGPRDLREVEMQNRPALFEFHNLPTSEDQRKPLQCPTCNVKMEKVVSERDEKVIMDRCPKCMHTWLDAGEIEALQTESLLATFLSLFRGPGGAK